MQIIKDLRKEKGVTQSDLAEAVGVSLRTIQTYEQKGANIPSKNLTKIATYFDLSIVDLHIREFNEEEATYGDQKPFDHFGSRCYPLDFGKHFILVRLILAEVQSDYVNNWGKNKKSKSEMKTGFVVETLLETVYSAFEVIGDAMYDGSIASIPNKAFVLGAEYSAKQLLNDPVKFINQPVVFVLKDRIICRQIREIDTKAESITCHNLNKSPEYSDFELPLDDVLEIYKVIKKQI